MTQFKNLKLNSNIPLLAIFFLLALPHYSRADAESSPYFYPPEDQAQPSADIVKCLTVVEVEFYDAHDKLQQGTLVINKDLAPDIRRIFAQIKQIHFPITSVKPINNFSWNDEESMDADNTSAYNYRPLTGGSRLSFHALGRAIDINPFCNPYVKNGKSSPSGSKYNPKAPCAFDSKKGKQIVRAFRSAGWTWGGNWNSLKDYQHFELPGANGRSAPYCR